MRLRSVLRRQLKMKHGAWAGENNIRWPNAFFADHGLYCLVKARKLAFNPVTGKTIDWRAVCGPAKMSGMPVQFGGRGDRETDLFYPYRLLSYLLYFTWGAPMCSIYPIIYRAIRSFSIQIPKPISVPLLHKQMLEPFHLHCGRSHMSLHPKRKESLMALHSERVSGWLNQRPGLYSVFCISFRFLYRWKTAFRSFIIS